jgi:hypothetical protein
MKFYSDTLTGQDFREALPAGTEIDQFEEIPNTRTRARGWKLHIVNPLSRRPANTGTRGAARMEEGYNGSASWDEWGHYMSDLFDRDPSARLGPYTGRYDFHERTAGKYRRPEGDTVASMSRAHTNRQTARASR